MPVLRLGGRPSGSPYGGVVDDERTGRTTNAERYRLLHRVAEDLVDTFESEFDVDRFDGIETDLELGAGLAERQVRLVPRSASAAPLTIAFTNFPGLALRLGRWRTEWFPRCGCDYCDEDPQALAREVREYAEAVAHGRFSERLTRGLRRWTLSHALEGSDWSSSGESSLSRQKARALGPPAKLQWEAWKPRAQRT